MRPTRTANEQHAVSSLVTHLRDGGCEVAELPEFTDRPDAALVVNGTTVAVECRTLTSERLLRMHGLERVEGRVYELYMPLEPNLWVQRAIEAKNHRIPEYLERCGAAECWLVVHSARGSFNKLAKLYNYDSIILFHMAVWQTPHDFERIYLTGEFDLPPVCIFDRRHEDALRPVYSRKKLLCIRTQQYFFGYVTATEGPNGQGQISMDFKLAPIKRFQLQPLDRRFRIDYEAVNTSRADESVLASKPSVIYAEPVDGEPQPGYYPGDA